MSDCRKKKNWKNLKDLFGLSLFFVFVYKEEERKKCIRKYWLHQD